MNQLQTRSNNPQRKQLYYVLHLIQETFSIMPSSHLLDRGREIWDYCFSRTMSCPASVPLRKATSDTCMSATSSTAATDEELNADVLSASPRSELAPKRKVVDRILIPLHAPYGQQRTFSFQQFSTFKQVKFVIHSKRLHEI